MFLIAPRGLLACIVYTWSEVQEVVSVSMRMGRPCKITRLG